MRILHVVPSIQAEGGGVSECVPRMAMAQASAGAEVGICTFWIGPESRIAESAEQSGVRFHRFVLHGGRRLNQLYLSWTMVRAFERIALQYDVIVTHASWMFPIWWAAHVARKLHKPYVMLPHGSFAPERLKKSAWKKKLIGWLDRHYARHATAVWTTSESEAEGVRKYVPGVRTAVFPLGLDWEGFQGFRGERDKRTLLFFSRISPIKGLDLLAEAWGRIQSNNQTIPNQTIWKLLIVGPDDRGYTEEIKKVFAKKCPAGSYEFRGPVYGEEKFKLLASVDAFVLPTHNENWSVAVAEAMASGLPVICTKGAPWECLEGVNAGRWVDISVTGIQKGIEDIFALNDEERQAMGERGRRWVRENLDWTAIAKKMIECL